MEGVDEGICIGSELMPPGVSRELIRGPQEPKNDGCLASSDPECISDILEVFSRLC